MCSKPAVKRTNLVLSQTLSRVRFYHTENAKLSAASDQTFAIAVRRIMPSGEV